MNTLLLSIVFSNTCIACVLAALAWSVGKYGRRPQIAHALWILVLFKMLTPPLVEVPWAIPAQASKADEVATARPADQLATLPPDTFVTMSDPSQLLEVTTESQPVAPVVATPTDPSPIGIATIAIQIAMTCWAIGALVVFVTSLGRVRRFHRLLLSSLTQTPDEFLDEADWLAHRFGLARRPQILTTKAKVSPLVWWIGGRVRVVFPESLIQEMNREQWKWVLAHELAHVRRRDYLVRWLEWLCCVAFWWNPIVWYAQRNLRATEEICCDALVLKALEPRPRSYANSILMAVESLAAPVVRPPAMASEINSGGFLERRFKMILSNQKQRPMSTWQVCLVVVVALVVIPIGWVSGQDYGKVAKRLKRAVAKGELTEQQADAMLKTLDESPTKDSSMPEKRAQVNAIRTKIAQLQDQLAGGHIEIAKAEEQLAVLVEALRTANRAAQRNTWESASERQAQSFTLDQKEKLNQQSMVIADLQKALEVSQASQQEAQNRISELEAALAKLTKQAGDERADANQFYHEYRQLGTIKNDAPIDATRERLDYFLSRQQAERFQAEMKAREAQLRETIALYQALLEQGDTEAAQKQLLQSKELKRQQQELEKRARAYQERYQLQIENQRLANPPATGNDKPTESSQRSDFQNQWQSAIIEYYQVDEDEAAKETDSDAASKDGDTARDDVGWRIFLPRISDDRRTVDLYDATNVSDEYTEIESESQASEATDDEAARSNQKGSENGDVFFSAEEDPKVTNRAADFFLQMRNRQQEQAALLLQEEAVRDYQKAVEVERAARRRGLETFINPPASNQVRISNKVSLEELERELASIQKALDSKKITTSEAEKLIARLRQRLGIQRIEFSEDAKLQQEQEQEQEHEAKDNAAVERGLNWLLQVQQSNSEEDSVDEVQSQKNTTSGR